jgi:CRISPR-associated protein Cas5t
MLCLYVQAPFAACRTFTAGWYRPTATFLTPSAAYGLVLNIGGIESRLCEEDEGHDGRTPASLMRRGLPSTRLALGAPAAQTGGVPYPRVQTVYQQLHNYPVGTSGSERAESAHGNKYNITPVRREFLTDLRALIAVDGNPDLEDRVRRGLRGEFNSNRYGLPFLGDNAFLLDRLEERLPIPEAHWYVRVTEPDGVGPRPHTTRLTILIDRGDLARTTSALFAPTERPTTVIPDAAWTLIDPPALETRALAKQGRKKQ